MSFLRSETGIDTPGVAPAADERLIETLAQHVHNVWARRRTAEGWRRGPTRDDARKEHPSLVSYEELSASEKQYDRDAAAETIRVLASLGYRITNPGNPETPANPRMQTVRTPRPSASDMDDPADEHAHWPALVSTLDDCRAILLDTYTRSTKSAEHLRRLHARWVVAAALSATLAVLLGIVQLATLDRTQSAAAEHGLPARFELAMAVAALACFMVADRYRRKWFVDRHRAERSRLLKFRYLSDPLLWSASGDVEACRRWLREEGIRIESVHHDEVKLWLAEDNIERPALGESRAVPKEIVDQLKEYFLAKRVAFQESYFSRQADRIAGWDEWSRKVPFVLFLLSVVFVLLHFTPGLLAGALDQVTLGRMSLLLMFLAAASPVIGAGVRTLLTAHEGTRNRTRYRSKFVTLEYMSGRLAIETAPEEIFLNLWLCEQVIESDHREWLRLMMEAEWFG